MTRPQPNEVSPPTDIGGSPKTVPTDVPVLDTLLPIGLQTSQITGIVSSHTRAGVRGSDAGLALGVQLGIAQAGMGNSVLHVAHPGVRFCHNSAMAAAQAAGITREDMADSGYDISRLRAEKQRDYRVAVETVPQHWDISCPDTMEAGATTQFFAQLVESYDTRPFQLLVLEPFWQLVYSMVRDSGYAPGLSGTGQAALDLLGWLVSFAAARDTHIVICDWIGPIDGAPSERQILLPYLNNAISIEATGGDEYALTLLKGREQAAIRTTAEARLDRNAGMLLEIPRSEDDRIEIKGDPEKYLNRS